MVAKSYTNLPIIGEPFEENKKMYIYVNSKGTKKKVRWYTEREYAKMYPEDHLNPSSFNMKPMFCGDNNHLWLFTNAGDETDARMLEYNSKMKQAIYSCRLGWFSKHETITDFPIECNPILVEWDKLAVGDELKPLSEIRAMIKKGEI